MCAVRRAGGLALLSLRAIKAALAGYRVLSTDDARVVNDRIAPIYDWRFNFPGARNSYDLLLEVEHGSMKGKHARRACRLETARHMRPRPRLTIAPAAEFAALSGAVAG
jgi:hypothetical protein